MNRTNRILAGLLVLQLVVAAVILWPRPAPASSSGPLFEGLTADSVTALTVQDDQGNDVYLVKQGDGWVLPQADDYPVQAERVSQLLDKIVALNTSRLVTQTSDSHKRLQVADDDYLRRVDMETADGKSYTLYVGSSPQARATHVRAGGQDQVYLASDLGSFDVGSQPSFYVSSDYQVLTVADISQVTLQNAYGELTFTKGDEGNWTLPDLAEGETLDQTAVSSLVNRAAAVRLSQPLGKVVTVNTTGSGDSPAQTVVLRVGAQDPEDSSYVVSSSLSPYVVRVAQFSAQDFVEKSRSDFLAQPTATPEAGDQAPLAPVETPQP
jgi:hypothetical protein